MDMFKPHYLGKLIDADNPKELIDFMINKYDKFCDTYDICRNHSAEIETIGMVDGNEFAIQVIPKNQNFDLMAKINIDELPEHINVVNNIIKIK